MAPTGSHGEIPRLLKELKLLGSEVQLCIRIARATSKGQEPLTKILAMLLSVKREPEILSVQKDLSGTRWGLDSLLRVIPLPQVRLFLPPKGEGRIHKSGV